MSFCSHATLNYDPQTGYYRCLDCIYQFEVKRTGTGAPEAKKEPARILPIIGIIAGLIFGLAVLLVGYKVVNSPSKPFFGGAVCQETEDWKKEAQNARLELTACLKKKPKVKIVELPCPEAPECPKIPDIIVPECPRCPEFPKYDPPECEECSRSYENEFLQCMEERGDALYRLGQCESRGETDSADQKICKKCKIDLKAANRKIEELRGVISALTLRQGGKCPSVDVRVPESDCSDEITAACGELREALEFYFKKSKTQPGDEDDEGLPAYFGPRALFEDEAAFEELDIDDGD